MQGVPQIVRLAPAGSSQNGASPQLQAAAPHVKPSDRLKPCTGTLPGSPGSVISVAAASGKAVRWSPCSLRTPDGKGGRCEGKPVFGSQQVARKPISLRQAV